LDPLSQTDLLSDGLHTHTHVVAVTRFDLLKGELPGEEDRGESPFRILLRGRDGRERDASADVVIDATGVFGNPNWLGQGGAPAIGETSLRPQIEYGIPDVLGVHEDRYSGKRVLLVGTGHTAAMNVLALVELAQRAPGTHVTWVTRSPMGDAMPGPMPTVAGDPFPERARVTHAANACVGIAPGAVTHWPGTQVESVDYQTGRDLWTVGLRGRRAGVFEFDRIVASVGYRPQNGIFAELQIDRCCFSGSPGKSATSPGSGNPANDSGPPVGGPQSLLHPEPNFYVLGAKSFGRNPDFLVHLGLRQIRDLFTIIGDRAALDLYEGAKKLFH
jgi:hypothetical protein